MTPAQYGVINYIQLSRKIDAEDSSGVLASAVYRLRKAYESGACGSWKVLDKDGNVITQGP